MKQRNQDVKKTILHQKAGMNLKPHGARPSCVKNFAVSLVSEGDLVKLKWTSNKSDGIDIDHYELMFDDESSKIIPIPFSQVSSRNYICTMRLGDPQIIHGETYTLKLRAINGSGPSAWSSCVTFAFKSRPAKPKKPTLTVLSSTNVRVEVKKLSQKEEHGSAVTQCQVQYMRIEQINEIEWYWTSLNLNLENVDMDVYRLLIGQLEPNTKYRFRVRMINSCGEGEPSEYSEIITDCVIPGPPKNVRISSKRLPEVLKIRWMPPSQSPG